MAHEVEQMFSVRETPWHRLGTILVEAPTFADALRIGGLDYEVEKRPTYVRDGTLYEESNVAFVTMRKDTGQELGAVGPGYTPCQNVDAFRVLEPLMDQGFIKLETGGSLREGADAWLLGKMTLPESQASTILAELGVQPYALVANNHSGRRGVLVMETPVRVVCANTLSLAERCGGFIVRHTGDVEAKVVEAAMTLWSDLLDRYETLTKQFRLLKAYQMDTALHRDLVVKTAIGRHPTQRKGWNPEARMATAVIERYEVRAKEIVRLWFEGEGHEADNSAWEAYNGLVQCVDHNEELFPTKSGVYRTAALLDGRLRQIKADVLTELVDAANRNVAGVV